MGASPNSGVNMDPASAEGGGTKALKKPIEGGPLVEGPCEDPKPNALSIADSGAFTSADTDSWPFSNVASGATSTERL